MINPEELFEIDAKRARFRLELQDTDIIGRFETLAKNAAELDCIAELIDKLSKLPKQQIESHRGDLGNNIMHSAAQSGNALLVRWLLENTSREQIHKRNIHGQTPLYYAIDAGQIEIVALFCIFGANISERDYFWDTPLEHALKIIERIRKDKEIEPGNKQHPSRLLQELTMIDIISWLKERACQQHRIDESPIDYSASRKALCLPMSKVT